MPDDELTAFLAMVTSDAGQESMTHDAADCADWRNSCTAHNTMRLAGMVREITGQTGSGVYAAPEDVDRIVRRNLAGEVPGER